MSEQPSTSISLLSIGSPQRYSPQPKSQFQPTRPSIPGRLYASQSVGLTAFLDAPAEEDEEESSANEHTQEQHFDRRRKKPKRARRRIARPKDSMPGFGKRRYGTVRRSRYSNSRFPLRGGGAVGGSRHLDRGINSATYYGRRDNATDSEEDCDQTALKQLGELEAGLNGVLGGDNPVCLVHGEPCIILVCKKPGKNKGREFFKCGKKQRYEQCDFFQWADEPSKLFSDIEDTDDDATENSVHVPAVFDVDGEDNQSLNKILRAFGHDKFRPGQAEALRLLLSGNSTLALLPTGGGKSLMYQMFAGVRSGVVVVITPLVSLMLDQLSCLPEELPGACLRSGQTLDVINATEQKLREGKVKVLFISPERLFSSRFRRLMGSRNSPKVSLVVLDEAHCISQWSHNFRTAYLRIPFTLFETPSSSACIVFREEPIILALTATATTATVRGICDSLRINPEKGVVRSEVKRSNLKLTLSRADAAVDAKAFQLVKLLKLDPFASVLGIRETEKQTYLCDDDNSMTEIAKPEKPCKKRRRTNIDKNEDKNEMIGWGSNLNVTKRVRAIRRAQGKRQGILIIYITKQKDCASVTNYLKSAALNVQGNISMYHAGLSQNERKKVQSQFERGSIAILVATVAFGMGLNYSNVGGVIHFDMPSSLEGYWQEVGRAGRDGRDAFCHILFNNYNGCRLLSRSHSDGVDKSTVRQLIRCLADSTFESFARSRQKQYARDSYSISDIKSTDGTHEDCVIHKIGSDQESEHEDDNLARTMLVLTLDEHHLQKSCDIKKETAETICALLESEVSGLRIRKWASTRFRLRFFTKSPDELLKSNSRALTSYDRHILDIVQKHAKQNSGHYDLELSSASLTEDQVIGVFNRLQSGRHISFEPLKQGLLVECPAYAHQKLKANAEGLAGIIHGRLEEIQKIRTNQALSVVDVFSKADEMLSDVEQSEFLHGAIQDYFATDWHLEDEELEKSSEIIAMPIDEEKMKDLRTAASMLSRETRYGSTVPQTARQIARILHGIDSASFRAKDWCRNRYWGEFVEHDFAITKRAVATVLREQHTFQKQGPKET